MTEVVLGCVCLALVVVLILRERAHERERRSLTNAVVAKHGGELIALERSTEPRKPRDPSPARVLAEQLDSPLGVG